MEDKNKEKRKKKIEFSKEEIGEDATRYGEFISSFFAWKTPQQQKKRVDELENMTENKEDKE